LEAIKFSHSSAADISAAPESDESTIFPEIEHVNALRPVEHVIRERLRFHARTDDVYAIDVDERPVSFGRDLYHQLGGVYADTASPRGPRSYFHQTAPMTASNVGDQIGLSYAERFHGAQVFALGFPGHDERNQPAQDAARVASMF
jgi:hypothetical protein